MRTRRGSPASTRRPACRRADYAVTTARSGSSRSSSTDRSPGHSRRNCIPISRAPMTRRRTAPRPRSSAGWREHATTRVGPRGAQVQVPVTEIEAVTVRHYTSRAGDPHRHLHLQINARVLAEGRWRGLHTVGVRDSLDAINGIGHAAVMSDPGSARRWPRTVSSSTADTGEVVQLAGFVGPFSARAAQISRNIGPVRGRLARRSSGSRARPGAAPSVGCAGLGRGPPGQDRAPRRGGTDPPLGQRTARTRLPRHRPHRQRASATSVGSLDRAHAVTEVLTRLGARRSAWNAADIRGEVEQLIARRNVVTDPAIRCELAEDLTARTLAQCVPLLDRDGVPEHIRALTSHHVLEVEADLSARLAARADAPCRALELAAGGAVFEPRCGTATGRQRTGQ